MAHDHDHDHGSELSEMQARVRAVETILTEKGLADAGAIARHADAWSHAARRAPHGTPIELKEEDFE